MDRPILFSGPMVRAIHEGRKTQTRRLVGLRQLQESGTPGYDWTFRGRAPIRSIAQQQRRKGGCWQDLTTEELLALCPYGKPGDRLWVRETWGLATHTDSTDWHRGSIVGVSVDEIAERWRIEYRAMWDVEDGTCHWRPAIHMPRWASRTTLLVTDVRVHRLQEIGEEDARAEGIRELPLQEGTPSALWTADVAAGSTLHGRDPVEAFRKLWDSINGERGPWASNPPVFSISFQKETVNG